VQFHQHIVEQAVTLQDVDPRIDPDQKRRPERQHDCHHQERLPASRRAGDAVGEGVADQEQDERRNCRNLQALEIGQKIDQVGEQQLE
jgi:hypothetical protein